MDSVNQYGGVLASVPSKAGTCRSVDRARKAYYLDYFPFSSKYGDAYHVLKHREQIVRGYLAAKSPRVRAKYRWLARYHNWSLNSFEFGEVGITDENASDYRIGNLDRASLQEYLAERTYPNFCVKGFGADLSTAEGVACDERPTRWASRVHVTPAG